MKVRAFVLSLLVAALGLTFAPAALPKQAAVKGTTITVTASEFKFKLSKTSAPHGKLTFHVVNRGKLQHDFKIAGRKTILLNPGKSSNLSVTLKKGSYAYMCTVAGHAAAGMKGTFHAS
jgi:uncharacterized cupredoxin-like copper-binding protein